MFNLFKYEVTSRWVSILGWGIGLAAFASMYIAIYPEMADQMQGLANLSIYRMMGIDIGSFAGYIASIVIQFIPLLLGVYVIMVSTDTLAGEEDNGTLELVVAMPLPRWQIVAMKAAALSVVLFLIMSLMGLLSGVTLSIVSQTTEVDATPLQLFVALLGTYPMLLAFFAIGLFFGAFMPSRRMAVAVMAFIYVGSYVANSAANIVDTLLWLKTISLFSYVNGTSSVFREGIDIGNSAVLFGVAFVFFALAIWSFQGRNITVGQWFWQRKQSPA